MGNCCMGKKAGNAGSGNGPSSGRRSSNGKSSKKKTYENSLCHYVTDKEDFDKQLKDAGEKLVVTDFFATWCGPCKQISPKLEEMAAQFPDIMFLKVDVDENEELANQFSVSSMPTFVFFKDGSKLKEFSGSSPDKIREIIGELTA